MVPWEFPEWFNGVDDLQFGVIPATTMVFLVLAVIFSFILSRTYFGRTVYAIGSNSKVAHYSGVAVEKTKMLLFAMVGAACGLAGCSRCPGLRWPATISIRMVRWMWW